MLSQPAALRLRQRRSAESVFAGQTTSIELAFKISQHASRLVVIGTVCEAAGQAHEKSEAILKVPHSRFPHDPGPIERPVSQHEPGQCLDKPRLDVVLGERGEKNLAWVLRSPDPGAQVGEPRVSQPSEVPRQRCRVDPNGELSPRARDSGRRQVVESCRTQRQLRSQRALASLEHRKVRLGHAKTSSRLDLAPVLAKPRGTKIMSPHGESRLSHVCNILTSPETVLRRTAQCPPFVGLIDGKRFARQYCPTMPGKACVARPDGSRAQRLYAGLKEAIARGEYLPGAHLVEAQLTAKYGASRATVREVLRRLLADDLVEHLPYRGVQVRRLSMADVVELYMVREPIEALAARLAAKAPKAAQRPLRGLQREAAGAVRARDHIRFARSNASLHRAIAAAAGNRSLLAVLGRLNAPLIGFQFASVDGALDIARAHAEHQAVLDAIFARDPVAAEAAMRRHLRATRDLILRAMSI